MNKFKKNYFIVTGGSGGIGKAICEQLSKIEITPIICYNTNHKSAKLTAAETNGIALRLDFSNPLELTGSLNAFLEEIENPSNIRGVILGASPPPNISPPSKIDITDLDIQLLTNVIGVQAFLSNIMQLFKKNKSGTIISILSEAIGSSTTLANKNMGAYVVAKTAQKTLLSLYAQEYSWLKVHTINPGFTNTKMLEIFDKRYIELLESQSKISQPADIAKKIINLINYD